MELVVAAGLEIAFQRRGEGESLVLLHGGVSDSRDWKRQLDGLSDAFAVVAWDAPGCGESSDPPPTFPMPDYADCLAEFIDALALDRPHVLGLSFGSSVALELYRRHPQLPRTLVLASAYAGWAGSLPPDVVADRLDACLRDADLPAEEWVPGWIPGLLTDGALTAMVEEVESIMSDVHPAGFRTMARSMADADLRDILPRIDVPTLLLYGDADERSPLHIAEQLHSAIPDSTLAVVPGAGHLCNVEAAERFNAEVRSFLEAS